jgi:SAM-dependent methyltransferase
MEKRLPSQLKIEQGQTQKNVNSIILTYFYNRFPTEANFKLLDLPCGNSEFLRYLKSLFPASVLTGADIVMPQKSDDLTFFKMDFTEDFTLPLNEQYDVVSSISGVMMFSNTLRFIKNCSSRLKNGGTFILTNDNNATIKDRLAYLFLGRYRIFNLIFEDDQPMTENVPINELVRLMRTHGIEIDDIEYTSLYAKDLLFLPFAIISYATQCLYLKRLKTAVPAKLVKMMYPFKHLFCRHYIIRGTKRH